MTWPIIELVYWGKARIKLLRFFNQPVRVICPTQTTLSIFKWVEKSRSGQKQTGLLMDFVQICIKINNTNFVLCGIYSFFCPIRNPFEINFSFDENSFCFLISICSFLTDCILSVEPFKVKRVIVSHRHCLYGLRRPPLTVRICRRLEV